MGSVMFAPNSYGGRRSQALGVMNAQAINASIAGQKEGAAHRVAFCTVHGSWVLPMPKGTLVLYAASGHMLELVTPEGTLVRYRANR
jgi:hypothetical protein